MRISSRLHRIDEKCSFYLQKRKSQHQASLKRLLLKQIVDTLMAAIESEISSLVSEFKKILRNKEREVEHVQLQVRDLIQNVNDLKETHQNSLEQQMSKFEAKLKFTNDGFAKKIELLMKRGATIMKESISRDMKKVLGVGEQQSREKVRGRANTMKGKKINEYKEEKEIEQHFGPQLLNNLDAMYLKAKVFQFTEKYEEAEKEFLKIIEINEMMRGTHHLKTLTAIYEYAITLAGMQRYEEAQNIFKEIISKRAQVKGEWDPEIMEWKHNFSRIIEHLRRDARQEEIVKAVNKFSLPAIKATQ